MYQHRPERVAAASRPAPAAAIQMKPRVQLKGLSFDEQTAALDPRGATPDIHASAQKGVSGGGAPMPHMAKIQAAFGKHDVSAVQAYQGSMAKRATSSMGAEAYATGDKVAFGAAPDLHTAAHEAAHVVQQRAGVSLAGGVGQAGDAYERQADAVADAVVQGKSAEGLLGGAGTSASAGGAAAVQRKDEGGSSTKKATGGSGGLDAKGAKAEVATTTTTTKANGDTSSSSTSASGQTDMRKGGNVTITTGQSDNSSTVAKNDKGEYEVKPGAGASSSTSYSGGYNDGTYSAGTTSKNNTTDDKGQTSGNSTGLSASAGKGVYTGNASSGQTNKDKSESSSNVGFGVDTNKGEFTANGGKNETDKDGTQSGLSGGATVGKGTLGANVGGSMGKKDDHSVGGSASGKYKFTATAKEAGGVAFVEWSKSLNGSVGGNGSVGSDKTAKVGGNVSIEGAIVESGKIVCKDMKEADDTAVAIESGRVAPNQASNAAAAGRMKAGDEWSSGSSKGFGMGVNASAEGIEVGASGKSSTSDNCKVVCKSEGVFEVTRSHSTDDSGSLNLGGGAIAISGGIGKKSLVEVTLGFDFKTKGAKIAYGAYVKSGKTKQPYTVVATHVMTSKATSAGVNVGPMEVTDTSTVTHDKKTDAEGNSTEEWTGERAQGWRVPLLGMSTSKSNKVDITETKNAKTGKSEKLYGVSTNVSSTSGAASAKALAESTGTHARNMESAKSSGNWTVTTDFTPTEIDDYCDCISKDDRGRYLVPGLDMGAVGTLRTALGKAKGTPARAEALSIFVSKVGAPALHSIRQATGAAGRNQIGLAGDKYFTGAAGRAALAQKANDLNARLAGPREMEKGEAAGVARDAAAVVKELEEKLVVISDHKKYTDLPTELRAEEMERTKADVGEFEGIYRRAVSATGEQAQARISGSSAGEADTRLAKLQKQLGPAEALLAGAEELMTPWRQDALRSRWVQLDGAWVAMGMRYASAYEALGVHGASASSYSTAEACMAKGDKARLGLVDYRDQIRRYSAEMADSLDDAEAAATIAQRMLTTYDTAKSIADSATDSYMGAETLYQDLKKRFGAQKDYKGYFEGYSYKLPKDYA